MDSKNYKSRGLGRDQLKKAYLLAGMGKKNICYFGHITLQHALFEGEIEGTHSRDRPRTRWMGNITEWSGFGYVEAARKAQDKNYWGNSLHPTQQWMEPDDDDCCVDCSHSQVRHMNESRGHPFKTAHFQELLPRRNGTTIQSMIYTFNTIVSY